VEVQSLLSFTILMFVIVILQFKKAELISIVTAMLCLELFIRDLFEAEAVVPLIVDSFY
jgi:hypothetical protein